MRVVILSSHSLYTEGVASRLREYPQDVDVRFVDPQQQGYIERVRSIQPAAIVINALDSNNSLNCLLCDLLISFSTVMIILIGSQLGDIQIITSRQHPLNQVRELIEIIENSPQE